MAKRNRVSLPPLRISICRTKDGFDVDFTRYSDIRVLRKELSDADYKPICIITPHPDVNENVAAAIAVLADIDLGANGFGRTLESIMTDVFTRGVEYGRRHPK